ncbi:helix-turn-helix domain-containing protein, partial [Mitsuokella jalaludinii]|uniref:helix-turn-helix domain-containing protein n=1 Tax=Mitsuokella jalaludinii TaxID=187979 RepID=UPI00311965F8
MLPWESSNSISRARKHRKGSENVETYTLGYKFRIYPNKTQARLINRTLGCARFVFNH